MKIHRLLSYYQNTDKILTSIITSCLLLSTHSLGATDSLLNSKVASSIKQSLISIGYNDTTVTNLIEITAHWRTSKNTSQVDEWLAQISSASSTEAGKEKLSVCLSLADRLFKNIKPGDHFDLNEVLRTKKAQCMGYAQLYWILANSLEIQTFVVEVERYSNLVNIPRSGHVCCISNLSGEESVMVDIAYGPMAAESLVSKPFNIREQFFVRGDYIRLKEDSNPLRVHREVRLLDTKGLLGSLYGNRAYLAHEQKKYDEAMNFYSKAQRLYTLDAGQINNMATTLHSLHRNKEALETVRKAISLRAGYAPAYHNLGNILRDMQKQQDAIAAYEKAVTLDNKLCGAWTNLGVCYYVSGEDRKAVAALEKANSIKPTDPQVLLHLGIAYGFAGEARKAQDALRKAVRLDQTCSAKAKSIQAFLEKQGVKATLED